MRLHWLHSPRRYAAVGGSLIFIQVLLGPPLAQLALYLAGEMHVDQIGSACVLGAEGAPPFITLKLLHWEVRAGTNGCHVGDLVWTVRDTEQTDCVDERSVKRILLKAKPDAFVSMMQDDKLNFDACELLQGSFDMPRCAQAEMRVMGWVGEKVRTGGCGREQVCVGVCVVVGGE